MDEFDIFGGKLLEKKAKKKPKIQPNPAVLILSLETAAAGANLVSANHVMFVQ
jgi:hypothetical protein